MKRLARTQLALSVLGPALFLALPALADDTVGPMTGPESPQALEARVRAAALETYVHGMTAEIAEREVGASALPALLVLLAEEEFPRRDNVVAFLAYLAGDESVDPLLAYLRSPPGGWSRPADDRALLLAPEALGRAASRGAVGALDALLRMTAPGGKSDPLGAAVIAGTLSAEMRGDLVEEALRGLALSGRPEALERLQELTGRTPDLPLPPKRVNRALRVALELLPSGGAMSVESIVEQPAVLGGATDASAVSHHHGLSYANHVDVPTPVGDAFLDGILLGASRRAGFPDFDEDVACCVAVGRSGTGLSFGTAGDGLDRIDTSSELNTVLGSGPARVKVVRAINFCGQPGTNIAGCAYTPGPAMTVVRVPSNEDALWLHEYGHNTGLVHNNDNRFIMYGVLGNQARGLSQGECSTLHTPAGQTQALRTQIGTCHDDDLDEYVSSVDNCPDVANPNQSDQDGDGVGDVCDGCVDSDDDGYFLDGDPLCGPGGADCDDSNALIHPGAPDLCDGVDNDCDGSQDEALCDEFDATGDNRVSGHELAWIGRAFGDCPGNSAGQWWLDVDYTQDGCIDGDDLAVLGVVWGCDGAAPVCE